MNCRICNDIIDPPERFTEVGKDYCKKPKCIHQSGGNLMNVVVTMVHKQGFNVVAADSAHGENYMLGRG